MALEKDIERWVCAKALDILGIPNLKLNVVGNVGWPDRIFWLPGGKPVLIEFKRPGGPVRETQIFIHEMLQKCDYDIKIFDERLDALEYLCAAFEQYGRSLAAEGFHEKSSEVFDRARRCRALSGPRTRED